jgi:rod shape-determining protein MreD
MSGAPPLPPIVETALLLGLGALAIFVALVPFHLGGSQAAPDLVFCLVIAWVIRRPARTPLWAILLLGLAADLLLARPVGLGALGLLLASEVFRRRATFFHGTPFLLEWLAAALGFAVILAAMQVTLVVLLAPAPGVPALGRHLVATALAYPVVVLGLTWCLRVRAPHAASPGHRPGRLS